MGFLYTHNGKLLIVNDKLASDTKCCCCCTCDSCVKYSVINYGNLGSEPPPDPEILQLTGDILKKCPTDSNQKFGCYDFEYTPEGEPANIGIGDYGYPSCAPIEPSYLCLSNDGNSVFFGSRANVPCVRLVCDQNNIYTVEVCIFNTCCGMESCAGRLTRKKYSVNLGPDNCPTSIGSEISSSVTDWVQNLAGWIPATIDLDGNAPNGQKWCNQDCWDNNPFNFIVGSVVGNNCCNEVFYGLTSSLACVEQAQAQINANVMNDIAETIAVSLEENGYVAIVKLPNLASTTENFACYGCNGLDINEENCPKIPGENMCGPDFNEPCFKVSAGDGLGAISISARCCGLIDTSAEPIFPLTDFVDVPSSVTVTETIDATTFNFYPCIANPLP